MTCSRPDLHPCLLGTHEKLQLSAWNVIDTAETAITWSLQANSSYPCRWLKVYLNLPAETFLLKDVHDGGAVMNKHLVP